MVRTCNTIHLLEIMSKLWVLSVVSTITPFGLTLSHDIPSNISILALAVDYNRKYPVPIM